MAGFRALCIAVLIFCGALTATPASAQQFRITFGPTSPLVDAVVTALLNPIGGTIPRYSVQNGSGVVDGNQVTAISGQFFFPSSDPEGSFFRQSLGGGANGFGFLNLSGPGVRYSFGFRTVLSVPSGSTEGLANSNLGNAIVGFASDPSEFAQVVAVPHANAHGLLSAFLLIGGALFYATRTRRGGGSRGHKI